MSSAVRASWTQSSVSRDVAVPPRVRSAQRLDGVVGRLRGPSQLLVVSSPTLGISRSMRNVAIWSPWCVCPSSELRPRLPHVMRRTAVVPDASCRTSTPGSAPGRIRTLDLRFRTATGIGSRPLHRAPKVTLRRNRRCNDSRRLLADGPHTTGRRTLPRGHGTRRLTCARGGRSRSRPRKQKTARRELTDCSFVRAAAPGLRRRGCSAPEAITARVTEYVAGRDVERNSVGLREMMLRGWPRRT